MSGLDSDKLKWTANGRNMKWGREAAEKIEDDLKTLGDEIDKKISVPSHAANAANNQFLAANTGKDQVYWGGIGYSYSIQRFIDKIADDVTSFLTGVAIQNDGKEYIIELEESGSIYPYYNELLSLALQRRPVLITFTFADLPVSVYATELYYRGGEHPDIVASIYIPWFRVDSASFSASLTFFFNGDFVDRGNKVVITAKTISELPTPE